MGSDLHQCGGQLVPVRQGDVAMSSSRFKALTGAVLGVSLLVSSTAVIAETNPAPAQEQVSPWAALAVLSGAQPAQVLCGSAAAAAAQPAGGCVLPAQEAPPPVANAEPPAPIPVPPVEVAGGGLGVNPLLLALAAIAAAAGLYFSVRNHDNSPA